MKTQLTLLIILLLPTLSSTSFAQSVWSHPIKAADGTIWSDALPGSYANCISKPGSFSDDFFVHCEWKSRHVLLGNSEDSRQVIDSDAMRACKAVGGVLPSVRDFRNLGDNFRKLDQHNINANSFFLTDISDDHGLCAGVFPSPGTQVNEADLTYEYQRNRKISVHCVIHPNNRVE